MYRAHHAVLGREVAVKIPSSPTRYAQERLMREAQMCATVRDVHVPRIYALDKLADGTIYIVMEKVAGLPLPQVSAGRRMPVRQAVQITCATLDAVYAVHKKGIVHRDIKPSNLLVDLADDPPAVSLLDFGVGKVVSSRELNFPALTCKGELLGTPMYMAPEQMLDQPVDARTDLYSVGVMLYELLAGRPPYPATSIAEVFAAVLRDDVAPLSTLRAALPSSMHEVVRKAMARNPDHRFDSARDMRKAIEAAYQDLMARPDLAALSELEELLTTDGSNDVDTSSALLDSGERKIATDSDLNKPGDPTRRKRSGATNSARQASQVAPASSPTRRSPSRRRLIPS